MLIKKQNATMMFLCCFLLLLASSFLVSKPYPALAATSTISLNTKNSYLIQGETTNLKVSGTTKKVIWTTSDKKVATVTSAGKVKAVGYGVAYIKATVNKKVYNCKVTVINPSEISFEPSGTTVWVNGSSVSLNPVSYYYDADIIKKLGITYKVSENSGVKISSAGNVTAAKAGKFNIDAYVHGKKISTIALEALVFDGFTDSELAIELETEGYISFAGGIAPMYEEVTVTSSNNAIATAEREKCVTMASKYDLCKGIYVQGLKEGTCTVTVTISGIEKSFKVIVGDGMEKLPPVEAVKKNDLTGYSGKALTTLTEIRRFIDDNNLLSDELSDKEKVTIIQEYLNTTYTGYLVDPSNTYTGHISGVFLKGAGGCESYAVFFSFICECINMDVLYCGGAADNGVEYGGHAWNRVKIDGIWYYIDTYWNACTNTFKYFLSETLWSNHFLHEEGYYADLMYIGIPIYSNLLE